MSSPTTSATADRRPTQEQAAQALMSLTAGYVGHRTVAMGLRQGLLAELADDPGGLTPDALAATTGLDAWYVGVWCRAGLAAGVLERDDGRYRLVAHLDTLLLDDGAPAYTGAMFALLEQPEVFDRFESTLASGERAWWHDASPAFVADVAASGRPFYTRLVPDGLDRVPGLAQRLARDCRVLDAACGTGAGLVRLAQAYPAATVVGADGDAASLAVAERRVAEAGLGDRVDLVETLLEDLDAAGEFSLVTNNISMHECRDADAVTANVHAALEPGGWFVVSDLPFPDTVEGLRSLPGRVMTGIQYWEAQIDDQLVPRDVYDDLLSRHGFRDIGSFALAPVHAVTHGRT